MPKQKLPSDSTYSDDETAQRRDEVVRRMANTPPQPKASPHPKKKKKVGAGHAAGKARATRAVWTGT